jgi:uncharacterized RDD family membrane protein YckC
MSTDLAPAVAPLFVARPAGIATRFAAFVFDVIAIFISFAIGGRVVEFVMSVLLRHQVRLAEAPTASTVALIVWAFVYCTVSLASSGQTPGMAILGVRVVDKDGRPLKTRHAIVRVLAFPFSFVLLGLGFVLILLRRDRRALHDLIGRSRVVYAWDVGASRSRFIVGNRASRQA